MWNENAAGKTRKKLKLRNSLAGIRTLDFI
jgi:hypothetical protein